MLWKTPFQKLFAFPNARGDFPEVFEEIQSLLKHSWSSPDKPFLEASPPHSLPTL